MIAGKTKRSFLNLVAMISKSLIVMIIGFISVPYLLKWLGSEKLGAYRLLIDWTTNISFLELGVGGSLIPIFCSAWSKGSTTSLEKTLVAGFWAYAKTLPVIFVACFILYLNLDRVISVDQVVKTDLVISFFIVISGFILLPFTVIQIYYEAIEKTFVTSVIIFIQLILTTIFSLFFAYLGYGIKGQAIAFLIGLTFLNVVLSFKLWRKFKNIWSDIFLIRTDRSVKKRIWSINWSNFSVNISRQVSFYMDNIIIGIFYSPSAVVSFFITVKLPLLLMGQLQNFGGAVWASLVAYHHCGNNELFNKRLAEITKIIVIVAVAIMVPIWVFNENFISLWVGKSNYLGSTITTVALLIALLQALNFFWGRVFVGTGHVKRQVFPSIFSAAINLILSLVLTQVLGMSGPVWGTLISFVCYYSWYQLYLLKKIYDVQVLILIRSIGLPFIQGLLVAFAAKSIVDDVSDFALLICMMTFVGILNLLLSWVFLLSKEERSMWRGRFFNRLRN